MVEQLPQKSNKTLIISSFVLFLLIIIGVAGLWLWDSSRLVVQDQPLDGLLMVDKVVLLEPGFVAIYNTNSLGVRGSLLLGVSDSLEPGLYEYLSIDINTNFTNQEGGKLLQPGEQVLFNIHHQKVGEEAKENSTIRGIFGQEIKKIITLN